MLSQVRVQIVHLLHIAYIFSEILLREAFLIQKNCLLFLLDFLVVPFCRNDVIIQTYA